MSYSEQNLLRDVIIFIVNDYGYSQEQIDFEVAISKNYRADCVIYSDEKKKDALIEIILLLLPTYLPLF